ncbi:hypothetical protein [Rhizobium sp. BK251]|uniref:hypothetical protein n=1 Tax=Rhizobium sp. BK251 TaxID=2512125 RepID=UPI00104A9FD6|nr:hypothetical protein [Rhizobium sp. BK251]TCL74867.1 hypothetical protein EV286_102430 [Rhizobium sp. BK251]
MKSIFAKAGIAALIALGGLSATIPAASAAGWERNNGGYQMGHDSRRDWDGPRRACSPVQAVQKARWHGMNRAHISDISPRRVVVEGRGRYGWGRVVFANVSGCPLIRAH